MLQAPDDVPPLSVADPLRVRRLPSPSSLSPSNADRTRRASGGQVGTDLAIGLFGKPTAPFFMRQVARQACTGLISQIARAPKPKRCGMFVISSQQEAAVGTESGRVEMARIRKLGQASAGHSIPHCQASMSNGREGLERRAGNDLVNIATRCEQESSLAGRYLPRLQIFAFRGEKNGPRWVERESIQFGRQRDVAEAAFSGDTPNVDRDLSLEVWLVSKANSLPSSAVRHRSGGVPLRDEVG